MITVKATKAESPAPTLASLYQTEEQKSSRAPYAIGLFLAGLAFYMRGLFPSWGSLFPEETPQRQPEEEPPGDPGHNTLAGVTPFPGMPDGDTTASATGKERPDRIGSNSPLLENQEPAEFVQIDSPGVELLFTEIGTFDAFQFQDARFLLQADNDNNGNGAAENPVGPDGGGNTPPDGPGDGSDPDNDPPEDGEDDEEDGDNEGPRPNRSPAVSGPVYLYDVYGCTAVLIGLSDFLRNASDPDGDTLSIANLTVSSGTIIQTGDSWLYDPSALGPVVFTYEITDGSIAVLQSAYLNVLRNLPIQGSDGDDTILGTDCADDIDGGAGDDNIDARGGDDTIFGGTGNDHIVAGAGNDVIFGGPGNDVIFGGAGNDWISGGAGDDRLFGDDGDDTIFGDEGNDLIFAGTGNDLVFGGTGNDTIRGEAGNDTIDGEAGDDDISGGDGDDTLIGGDGCDVLDGGSGNDALYGGAGSDSVYGGAGDDFVSGDADCSDDIYDGGEGRDTIDYSASQENITADLAAGVVEGDDIGSDTVLDFEVFVSGAGDDTIIDGAGVDTIRGGAGDDRVVAAADGADDAYYGGTGTDTLDYSATKSGVMIDLKKKTATGLEIGSDSFGSFETFVGGSGNDTFVVGTDPVKLKGGAGNDVFQFTAAAGASHASQLVHQILDFMVGDRIKMSRYDIFDEVMDTLEDRFEDIYGNDDEDDLPIRIRHEQTDNTKTTYVEADFDRNEHYELSIKLDGHHMLIIVENA